MPRIFCLGQYAALMLPQYDDRKGTYRPVPALISLGSQHPSDDHATFDVVKSAEQIASGLRGTAPDIETRLKFCYFTTY